MTGVGTRRAFAALALWVSLTATSTSLAETQVGLVAHIDARAAALEEAQRFDAAQQLTVGTEVRGALGSTDSELTYLAGLGYQLGAARELGFVYDAHVLPLGFGVDLGDTGMVGVLGGARLSGVTASVPLSAGLLSELRAEVALGDGLLLSLWCAPSWEGAKARRGGAPSVEFIDESSSGVAVRFGAIEHGRFGRGGSGLLLGALYFERGDARGAGLVVGLGLNTFGARF